LQKGFIGLALRNEELLKSNDQLKQQLETVVEELNQLNKNARKSRSQSKLAQIENVYPSVIQ
jgi:hypothetical protein